MPEITGVTSTRDAFLAELRIIEIVGADFGFIPGRVVVSPADDINDSNALSITTIPPPDWEDDRIVFSLAESELRERFWWFVEDANGFANASGFPQRGTEMPTVLPTILTMDRETTLFAKKETTAFTEIKPDPASQVLIAGEGSVRQARGFIADPQRRNTLSQLHRFSGRFEPGEATFPVLVKPTGTLGTPPECDVFLEALFGRKTVTPGVKVQYDLLRITDLRPTLTIWLKQGHFVYRCIGSVVSRGQFPLRAGNTEDALCTLQLTITFAQLKWTGTDELAAVAAAAATNLSVKDGKKFTIGSYITIGTDDNTGLGYQVTAVDYTSNPNVLTLGTPLAAGHAIDELVRPWAPTGTEVGNAVHGRLGFATRGGANLALLTGEMILENQIKMMNEEKNGLDYANRFIHSTVRNVNVNAEVYFDANATKNFYEAYNQVRGDVVFPWGDTPANRFTLKAKNVEIDAPEVSGTEEKTQALSGQAFASSALDDELQGIFD